MTAHPGHTAPVGVPLLQLLRTGGLSVEQRRTVVVAVALDVAAAHRGGRLVGPVHPRDVVVPATGRPTVVAARVPGGWSLDDDVVAVRRLLRALLHEVAQPATAAEAARLVVSDRTAALPALRPPAPSAPPRRWWGRAS